MAILAQFRLEGRVAIVTGASSGLGETSAIALAEAGADVVLAARRTDLLEKVASQIEDRGRTALVVRLDVSEPSDCAAVVDAGTRRFGHVDVLVNNAGIATARPATRERPEEFRAVLEVNLFGAYWMAQACGRVMRPGSSIINVGSVLGLTTAGLPQAAYASSKAAIMVLTRDLAAQWSGRKGIRVNVLIPELFDSEMTARYSDAYVAGILERAPMARAGEHVEYGAALVFLASPASSYMTGSTVAVDGGILIT